MTYPTISALPTPPSRQDPANFATEADAFLGALPTLRTEINAAGDYIETKAEEADTDAAAASASATAAATSETNAASSATASADSATNSANSATASASSAASAADVYDQFDDRYLGSKTSDPATDNDGNALLTGALYYNTTIPQLKIYDGAAWQQAAFNVDATGALLTTNNLSDLDNAATALGNLGLTSTAAEINTLDGFTGTVADLNYAKDLRATGVTTTEFDKLDGLTATTTELNYVDGVTRNIQEQLDDKLNTSWVTKTTTYTAVAGDRLLGDTSGTAFTITLPALPTSGDEIWFADPAANWEVNNITVDGNGKNIDGSSSFAADVNGGAFIVIYNGTDWVVRLATGVV